MDFLKEFGKQFSGKARSGSDKSREAAELNRISAEMRDAEALLEQLYTRYGRACYALQAGQGNPEAAKELALRIRAARIQAEELETARDAISRLKRCANCGTVSGFQARYCSACGRKLPEEAPKPEPVELGEYCPACGAKREDDEPRCPVCGADYDAPSAPGPLPDPEPGDLPAPEEPDGAMD